MKYIQLIKHSWNFVLLTVLCISTCVGIINTLAYLVVTANALPPHYVELVKLALMILNLFLICPICLFGITFHEIGHAKAGEIVGLRALDLISFGLGSRRRSFSFGVYRIEINKTLLPPHVDLGALDELSPEEKIFVFRSGHFLYVFFMLVVVLFLGLTIELLPDASYIKESLWSVFDVLPVALLAGFANFLPIKFGEVGTDGWHIREAKREGFSARV
ncbi:hypothetical protein [Vibrio sp. D431a]|uniref:hypothetical protein n=1 Tax=Vibrio sp. D431a TaxID=2837388 RepID=UPI0025537A6E|nr:hypothetical protein [Vibrio sp. D431a]MDK9789973.1 hypothetical protein [Vibrio sp. D431a]